MIFCSLLGYHNYVAYSSLMFLFSLSIIVDSFFNLLSVYPLPSLTLVLDDLSNFTLINGPLSSFKYLLHPES